MGLACAGGRARSRAPATREERAFLGIAAVLFAAATAVTIAWCASMADMDGMPMPGGWTMSMTWMRMPGQSWAGAVTAFLGMWLAMMIAMMLPSLVPMLRRYRTAAGAPRATVGRLTLVVAVAYFGVWALLGAATFPLGVALAAAEMASPALARAVPFGGGAIVLIAGVLQFTAWKARRLACCRQQSAVCESLRADARTAWRHGVRLGLQCCGCCAGATAVLLVLGVMDLRAMAAVTAAITLERLAPAGARIARALGVLTVGLGGVLIAHAFAFG